MATTTTTSSSNDNSTTVTLKLLIDSKAQRVLFAEAGKDFADFLFTLLSLPVATVIRLLSTAGMVGTIGKLYDSFQNLNDTYIQPNLDKDILLKPTNTTTTPVLLSLTGGGSDSAAAPGGRRMYVCNTQYACGNRHASDDPRAVCPTCNRRTSLELPYVAPPKPVNTAVQVGGDGDGGGFVKGVVTYMIMDDLEVKPMSTISSIAMLNKFNVKEVGALEERTVSLGIDEGVKLLKASLQTKNVLSNVFLGK